jgi:hypothetical protein
LTVSKKTVCAGVRTGGAEQDDSEEATNLFFVAWRWASSAGRSDGAGGRCATRRHCKWKVESGRWWRYEDKE